jgi:hypothetical protein
VRIFPHSPSLGQRREVTDILDATLGERDDRDRPVVIERPAPPQSAAVEAFGLQLTEPCCGIARQNIEAPLDVDQHLAHLFDGRRYWLLQRIGNRYRHHPLAQLGLTALGVDEEVLAHFADLAFVVAVDHNAVHTMTQALPFVADNWHAVELLSGSIVDIHLVAPHDRLTALFTEPVTFFLTLSFFGYQRRRSSTSRRSCPGIEMLFEQLLGRASAERSTSSALPPEA